MQDLKDLIIMNAEILGKKVCFQATFKIFEFSKMNMNIREKIQL